MIMKHLNFINNDDPERSIKHLSQLDVEQKVRLAKSLMRAYNGLFDIDPKETLEEYFLFNLP